MIEQMNMRKSFKYYKENYIPVVDKETYIKLVGGLMQLYMKKIFQGYPVKMGAGLGVIQVLGTKIKTVLSSDGEILSRAKDWKATIHLWNTNPEAKEKKTYIYHLNEHTNGVRYKITWMKKDVNVENKFFYTLVFSRHNKRELARLIKDGSEYDIKTFKT